MDGVQEACESLVGEQFQEYLVESVLAIGTYGAVFELKSTKTNERFAGKCLFKAGLNDSQIELQREEVKFNKTIGRHPNVCYLENFVETEDHIVLVFELCDGGDLYDSIKQKKVAKEDVQVIFNQILSGIQHCHSKGVYHRDLKPENILLTNQKNTCKIADFGLATYEKTPIRHKIGSTQYMAPELFDLYVKHYKSEKVDVWALAVILFNLLTNSNPWSIACPTEDHQFLSFLQRGSRYFRDRFHFSDKLCQFFTQAFSKDFDIRPTLDSFKQSFNSLTMDDLLFRSAASFSPSHIHTGVYSPPRSVEKSILAPKSPATSLLHKFTPSSWADDDDLDIDYDEPFSLGDEEEEEEQDDDSSQSSDVDIQFSLDISDEDNNKNKNKLTYGHIPQAVN